MYRVAGMVFNGQINYNAGSDHRMIAITVPDTLTEAQIIALKNAELIEVLGTNTDDVIGSYRLTGWRRMEKVTGGIQFMWATITTVEVDTINARIDLQGETISDHTETLQSNAVELSDILDAITELGDLIAEMLDPGEEPEPDPIPEEDPEVEGGE